MSPWLDALAAAERDGQPAVLVTVLSARGSTPREAGAKMVVSADGIAGTIGGGNLEFQCEAVARGLLADGATGVSTRDFPLGPALGQCCGGHVTVLFEVLRPPVLHVALFGAGHVGKALVRLLGDLPCRVTWVDPRPEALPAAVPANVRVSRAVAVEALPSGCVVLVMTHDHGLDFEIVAAALARDDLPFVGLIGSETKRARFVSRLRVPADRLVCPIGVPGIEGKAPAVVALAVAAQVMQSSSARVQTVTAGPTPVMAGPGPAIHDFDPPLQQRTAPMPAPTRSCAGCACPPAAVR